MPSAPQEKEFFFPDLKKNVLVQVPAGSDLTELFNEVSHFIKTLIANNNLRDLEAGLDPPRPTHAITKDADNHYHLQRLRFQGIV
jgi:hypothetical protein